MFCDNLSTDNLDSIQGINALPSGTTSDESIRFIYDYNTHDSFCEIDFQGHNIDAYSGESFTALMNYISQIGEDSEGNLNDFLLNDVVIHDNELNPATETRDIQDEQLDKDEATDPILPVMRSNNAKSKGKPPGYDQSIPLSDSVAVTVPTQSISSPNQLIIVQQLEEKYRPRYKSDYFPQNGIIRRPRYVADTGGNHFVSIQLPEQYNRKFEDQFIRVALITTWIGEQGHYYSPYKFQVNHKDSKVPDQNPIYVPVTKRLESNSIVKLQLVLIKSKLDQLYEAQPLKIFSDGIAEVHNIINEEILTSKELINKYRLDRSHIAFTLCTKLTNGTYDVHSETTAISSIISEASASASKSESTIVNSEKIIKCPHCSHCFQLANETKSKKLKTRKSGNGDKTKKCSKSHKNNRINKRKKTE